MNYRVGICDDEMLTCSELEAIIINTFKNMSDTVSVNVWNSAESLMADIPSKIVLDILFLDIELPESNGVEVGNYIREQCNNEGMHIIFISSKTSYAMELFKIHPYDFLVKPIDTCKVENVIKKLLQLDEQDKRFFEYEYNKNLHKLLIGDIVYFMSNLKHIKVVCVDAKDEHIYVGKIKNEINKLPENFVRINQSCIINLRHIKECHIDELIMDNGDRLGITRGYRDSFNKSMLEYSMRGGR